MSCEVSICKMTRYVFDDLGLNFGWSKKYSLPHHITPTATSSVDSVVTSAADEGVGVEVVSLIHLISICKFELYTFSRDTILLYDFKTRVHFYVTFFHK